MALYVVCGELILFFPIFTFDPLEAIIKLMVSWYFQEGQKGTLWRKGLINKIIRRILVSYNPIFIWACYDWIFQKKKKGKKESSQSIHPK